MNSIAEVERKIRLYNTSLLKILTISHSATAAHHYCEHCHHPQQPIIIYCLNYLKGWSGVFFFPTDAALVLIIEAEYYYQFIASSEMLFVSPLHNVNIVLHHQIPGEE